MPAAKTSSRKGLLLVISAPSGTGKSTLIRRLRVEFPRLAFSVSYTTRQPRTGEQDGQDYHFVSDAQFQQLRENDELAEWAEVHGHSYGSSRTAVLEMLDQGRDILFDIDVQGAKQLRETFAQGIFLFLFPPSMAALEQRLRGRGTEDQQTVDRRLANARREVFFLNTGS
jgi:guanylate kinase